MRPSLGVRQKIFGGTKKKRATLTGTTATTNSHTSTRTDPEEGESEAAMSNEEETKKVKQEEEDDDDEDLFGDAEEADTEEKTSPAEAPSKTPKLESKEVAPVESSASGAVATTKDEADNPPKPEATTVEIKKEAAPAPAPVASGVPGFTSTTAAVPRKKPAPASSSSPASTAETQSNGNGNQGTRYGLPPGVRIPPSVLRNDLLHGKALDALKKIPVELMNESLTEYDDAVQIKGESIRNHSAYLYGVIKRYVDVQETRGGAGTMMQTSLTFAVHKRLEQLVRSGYCTQLEMDEKV